MKGSFQSRCQIVFVIPTWNRKEKLRHCLDSVKSYIQIPCRILVIDNASTDGTYEWVKNEYPDVILIRNTENEGFSRAANKGLDYLDRRDINFDYVVFLNDDAEFRDDSMHRLIYYMEKNLHISAALPSVFSGPHRLQTGAGGYRLSLKTAFYYFFGLSIFFPWLFKGFFIHQPYYRKKRIILELDWISGVCLVLRQQTAKKLRFPENFFMYAEDTALCREIIKFGKIIYFPLAQVYHLKEKNTSSAISSLWLDSLFQYYGTQNKGQDTASLRILKIIFISGFLIRIFGYILIGLFSRKNYRNKKKELLSFTQHVWESMER